MRTPRSQARATVFRIITGMEAACDIRRTDQPDDLPIMTELISAETLPHVTVKIKRALFHGFDSPG